jgi:prepilin-type N-terminal cleavage/methylation domain-containing protein
VRHAAFSLVELLVVIAILAMLLLPGVALVKDTARSSVCSSNLRQLGFGFFAYGEAYGDIVPPVKTVGRNWFTDISAFIDDGGPAFQKVVKGCPVYTFKPTPWQNGYAMNNFLLSPSANGSRCYDNNSAAADGVTSILGAGNLVQITWSRLRNRSQRVLVADTSSDENLWGSGDVSYRHHGRGGVLLCDFRTVMLTQPQAENAIWWPANGTDY